MLDVETRVDRTSKEKKVGDGQGEKKKSRANTRTKLNKAEYLHISQDIHFLVGLLLSVEDRKTS